MRNFLKRVLFGRRPPYRVLLGPGSGIMMHVDPQCQAQRLLGLAEAEIAKPFAKYARSCQSFIDIGASDGWYCLLARRCTPKIRVVAIDPEFSDKAHGNLEANHFDRRGFREVRSFCGTPGIPLDELGESLPEPIFIKMDIDGAELAALRSGTRLLQQKECRLIVETHSAELENECSALLRQLGYRVRIIDK